MKRAEIHSNETHTEYTVTVYNSADVVVFCKTFTTWDDAEKYTNIGLMIADVED